MSSTRHRWLLVIILLEVIAIAGLVAWVLIAHPGQTKKASAPSGSAQPTATLRTPQINPDAYASGLKNPVAIASPKDKADKRLFVAEQKGTIRIVTAKNEVSAQPFLDISAKTLDDGAEMGLLGLAFHPDFTTNGFFYAYYIDKQQNSVVARYHAANGIGDPASEKVLIKVKQPYSNHNGGSLQFGPDGYLYIAFGDGGSQGDPENRAQNPAGLLGKILRIDVNKGDPYAVPSDNPFVNKTGYAPEIWALGLRNPWRTSFDRQTGDFYIADVGQNKIEEINILPAQGKGGENFGWRCYEGETPYNSGGCAEKNTFTLPSISYDHAQNRCSVTGGYVYRGSVEPALKGKYIYGDFCSGQIYAASKQGNTWEQSLLLKTAFSISTFGEDSNGELYLADLAGGNIYHLQDTAN